jgi:hypothetical protein
MNIFSSNPRTFKSSLLTDQDPYGMDNWLSLRRKLNFMSPEMSNPDRNVNPIRTDDDTDLDEIVKRGSTDLEMLREHIAKMPKREDYAMSTKDRILASLVAGAGSLASGDVRTGVGIGQKIVESPYQRALEDYKMKASGLSDIAEISDKQLGRHVQLENIQNTHQDRQDRIQQSYQAEQDRHEDRMARASTDLDRLTETERHNKEMERLQAENNDIRASNANDEEGITKFTTDDQGRITAAYNSVSGKAKPVDPALIGQKLKGMSSTEITKQADLKTLYKNAKDLEDVANSNKGAIGLWEGGVVENIKRNTIGASDDVNDLFHISDDLADMLLRARSGAQINEKEYRRLRRLVPNPRGPEAKFFSDLRRFKNELATAYRNRTQREIENDYLGDEGANTGGNSGNIPEYVTDPKTGELVLKSGNK